MGRCDVVHHPRTQEEAAGGSGVWAASQDPVLKQSAKNIDCGTGSLFSCILIAQSLSLSSSRTKLYTVCTFLLMLEHLDAAFLSVLTVPQDGTERFSYTTSLLFSY